MPSPALFRHMVLAIFEGRKVPGSGSKRFDAALKVAAANLVNNRHAILEGEDYEALKLTPSGEALNLKHVSDRAAASKDRRYETYYGLWSRDYRDIPEGKG